MTFSSRTRIIGIHKAPAHLSPQDMEKKYRDLASAFASLPIVKQYCLKYEVCFANGKFEEHVRDINLHGFEVTVVSIVETESEEALKKIMTDPAFQKVMEGADFLDRSAGGSFGVDVLSFIDRASQGVLNSSS